MLVEITISLHLTVKSIARSMTKELGSTFFRCFCSIIIWIGLSFTAVPILIIVFTFRLLSSKLVPFVYVDISKIVSATSSVFASHSDEHRSHVVSCFGLEGIIELEDLRATFESRIIHGKTVTGDLQWPELQQCIVHKLGLPFWKWDKSFNIQNHIHILKADSKIQQNSVCPQDILDIIEEKVIHKSFPVTRSPWEILLVPNFEDTPIYGKKNDTGALGTMLLCHFDHIMGSFMLY